MFGFVTFQVEFVRALQSFPICANSHHLANLANVDGWIVGASA